MVDMPVGKTKLVLIVVFDMLVGETKLVLFPMKLCG